jgi:hypothetical protein
MGSGTSFRRLIGAWREVHETASWARYADATLALVFVVSGARAGPVFSFEARSGKLPKTVVSIGYSIELRLDAESPALLRNDAALRLLRSVALHRHSG